MCFLNNTTIFELQIHIEKHKEYLQQLGRGFGYKKTASAYICKKKERERNASKLY